METVEKVFGSETTDPTAPEFVIDALASIIDEYEMDKDEIKGKAVDYLNNPSIASISDETERWKAVLRAVNAYAKGPYALVSAKPMLYEPLSVGFKGIESKKEGRATSWSVRMFGLVRSLDAETELEGPSACWVTGFLTEDAAKGFINSLHIRRVYKIMGNVSKKSPTGKLSPGTSAAVFCNAGVQFEPYNDTKNDAFWNLDSLFSHFPLVTMSELLTKPVANQLYHIEGEIVRTTTTVDQANNPRANLTLSDDSVNKELAKANNGGIFSFLPKEYISVAALPVGSRIAAIVEGYDRKEKDQSGNYTGNSRMAWNVHAVKTIIDLSGGTEVPNPGKAAVNIQEPAAVVNRRKLL
jgi:hypothetical protein